MVSRRVLRGQQAVEITPREYDLPIYLAQHGGEIVSREMLAKDVWHETSRATPLDNVIDVHMHHLRKKLSNAGGDSPLKVIRGIGVRLDPAS
jgi:DNA-binding response OmpR family regulator